MNTGYTVRLRHGEEVTAYFDYLSGSAERFTVLDVTQLLPHMRGGAIPLSIESLEAFTSLLVTVLDEAHS